MDTNFMIIAIDGGAASGKSSTARQLAATYHFMHVDTGTHYRALTLALTEARLEPHDAPAVTEYLKTLPLGTHIHQQSATITLNGHCPEASSLRSPAVNATVSHFAALPCVRTFLLNYQRGQADLARAKNFTGLIMEGRDIGSVIFPNADLRLFFFADERTRAERRRREGAEDFVGERDKIDSTRKTAPFICPEGAHKVDTSSRTLKEVVDYTSKLIEAQKNAEQT